MQLYGYATVYMLLYLCGVHCYTLLIYNTIHIIVVVLLYVVPCYCRYIAILQILLDTGVNTFTPTAFTPATTPATNTLVATVGTVDIAYYTTAYTPILLYSYHVLLACTYRYYCTPIYYTNICSLATHTICMALSISAIYSLLLIP